MIVHTVVTPYRADWFIDVKIRIIACSRGTRRRSLSTSYLRFVRSDTVKRYRTKVQCCSSGPRKGFSLGFPPLFFAFCWCLASTHRQPQQTKKQRRAWEKEKEAGVSGSASAPPREACLERYRQDRDNRSGRKYTPSHRRRAPSKLTGIPSAELSTLPFAPPLRST